MKPSVSPFSTARPTLLIGIVAMSAFLPDVPYLCFAHSHVSQRRVDVKGVGRNAIADSTVIVVQQIRGDDFKIVIGRVSKPTFSVAIAECPDAGHVGAQFVVDHDVSAFVAENARFFQSEIVGVRLTANREEYVRSDLFGLA